MAKTLGAIFGAPEIPEAPPEKEETQIDPNREAELSAAAKQKRAIFSRRGRNSLRTKGGQSRGGVSFGGGGKTAPGSPTPAKGPK